MSYYNKHISEVFTDFSTSENGLLDEDVKRRLNADGENIISKKRSFSAIKSFLGQFSDTLIIILIVAALISILLGEKSDAFVIITIILLNATIGFLQEYRANKAIEALKQLITPTAKVIRGGELLEIPAKYIVTGDIVSLEEGDKVAADCRIIMENDLRANESILTGESLPARKTASIIIKSDLVAADQKNMVFMGTSITHGNAKAIVTATGKNTEFGKIADATQTIKEELSPLQKEILSIGKFTAKATFWIAIFVIIFGLWSGQSFISIFFFAISLGIAVVPEGLPTTLTIGLAFGVQKMAKESAIIRKLSSVETLGSTTVICSDKTGTLTKNQLTVKRIWANNRSIDITGAGYEPIGKFYEKGNEVDISKLESFQLLFNIATICNNSKLKLTDQKKHAYDILGDPTEGALIVAATKLGISHDKIMKKYVKVHEIPFDSDKKRMITINRHKRENFAFLKGGPYEVLDICNKIQINGKVVTLTKSIRKEIDKQLNEMGNDAMRILGFAYKKLKTGESVKGIEHGFIFVGLMGMSDPLRFEVIDAVKECFEAGIRINIITGDFGETAKAIAIEAGLADKNTPVINGEEIEKMDNTELQEVLRNDCIFARVSPSHKLKIVTNLQEMGEIVAVTGDGVNDAPALKKANIGISMGASGTDVARESSDMVLSNDSFATIVRTIEQGRGIYNNLQRLILYIFSGITGELFTVILAFLFGFLFNLPLPLIAIHILLIDLGAEILPSLALALEPAKRRAMKLPPRDPNYRIMNKNNLAKICYIGVIIAVGTLFLVYKTLTESGWVAGNVVDIHSALYVKVTTVAFSTIIMFQMFNALNSKTLKSSIISKELFSNKYLLMAVGLSAIMTVLLVQVPFFNKVLHTYALSLSEWGRIMAMASSIFFIEEIRKLIVRRRFRKESD